MKISKANTYFLSIGILVTCCLVYQAVWQISDVTNGVILKFEHGTDQFKYVNSATIQYYVNDIEYVDTYLRSNLTDTTKVTSIRYLTFAPSISRLDTPTGMWGLISGIFLVFFLSLTILFLRKDIIPKQSHFLFDTKRPFIKIVTDSR
jgi:hypothetical protein